MIITDIDCVSNSLDKSLYLKLLPLLYIWFDIVFGILLNFNIY